MSMLSKKDNYVKIKYFLLSKGFIHLKNRKKNFIYMEHVLYMKNLMLNLMIIASSKLKEKLLKLLSKILKKL